MTPLNARESQRLIRYHSQSLRLLQDSMDLIRQGRWSRCEDLLWGSLTLAVKGVALSRGQELTGQQDVRKYAEDLGKENRDRRIRDSFSKLASFPDAVERASEYRRGANHLVAVLEDVAGAIERLWEMLPLPETTSEADRPPENNFMKEDSAEDDFVGR